MTISEQRRPSLCPLRCRVLAEGRRKCKEEPADPSEAALVLRA